MAPQFVDYNADGHTDIVTATFDGSPHVSLGSKDGFHKPERILDGKGTRVMLAQFWNYKAEKWDENPSQPKGHCTSAVVFDWDNDGDFDLLLGSYGDGNLYRQMNEGSAGKPNFTGVNIPVLEDGNPLGVQGGITTPRLVDWNGDGLMDLLCGGYGNSYTAGIGGVVSVYLNTGKQGEPSFGKALSLIGPGEKGGLSPTRPDTGLYPEAVDYDGDGDLDLVVGGYSHWKPDGRILSTEEKARADDLTKELSAAQSGLNKLYEEIPSGEDATDEEVNEAYKKLRGSEDFKTLTKLVQTTKSELDKLIPPSKRESFVWLYRRTKLAQ